MAEKKNPAEKTEKEYIIPLRRKWVKVPRYKRANKAVKIIKTMHLKGGVMQGFFFIRVMNNNSALAEVGHACHSVMDLSLNHLTN